jgi:hypothetical protein
MIDSSQFAEALGHVFEDQVIRRHHIVAPELVLWFAFKKNRELAV